MKLAFLLLSFSFVAVTSFEFQDPHQADVTFGSKTPTAQVISVKESNDGGRVKIVSVTGVAGPLTVKTNSQSVIDVETENAADASENTLSMNLLDYEALVRKGSPTVFAIDVYENNDIMNKQTLSVNIVNLDDESPTLWSSACSMKENTQVDVDSSDCVFIVHDADGWLASMDFSKIIGTQGEDDLFEFKYKDIPDNTTHHSEVYLVLKDGKTLDFETTFVYSFSIQPADAASHPTFPLSDVPILVRVLDVPDQPPRWNSAFSSVETVTENTRTTFTVSASDGDIGINSAINYNITKKSLDCVSIDKESGEITIGEIDRDDGNDQVTFTVRAYEVDDPDSYVDDTITLIVIDQDDNAAVIGIENSDDKKIDITIDENSVDIEANIFADDIDLGDNAVYNVTLVSTGKVDYASAFSVTPEMAFEQTYFALTVVDPSKLDYEDVNWKKITMELRTIGIVTPANVDTLPITVTLKDINDEVPVFTPVENAVTVPENQKAETLIITITATDKDQEDIDAGLKYELLGDYANTVLTIDEPSGDVSTKIDNAFDYEKQQTVVVDIRATDQANHQAVAQLTLTITDVNDESPKLAALTPIRIDENQPDGTVLEAEISASDDDTDANLEFSIDWDNSYATKNSIQLSDESFATIRCVEITTVADSEDNKVATAQLTVTQPETLDFEVFDELFLMVVVTDLNQADGNGVDSAYLVISVQDVNDNAPVFGDDIETEKWQVMENAAPGTLIATVVAVDLDIADVLTYSIEGVDKDSPSDWVTIDETGLVTVNSNSIDCDNPVRESVKYNVTASDGTFTTTATITVDIIDTNDNAPTMESLDATLAENSAEGVVVLTLTPEDGDRDDAYNTVKCDFAHSATTDVTNQFEIVDNEIKVRAGATLDRESQDKYVFELSCNDDPDQQGYVRNFINPAPVITITLDDVNDNPPTIYNTDITGQFDESSAKGTTASLEGRDADDPKSPNSKIEFQGITKIQRFINKDDTTPQNDPPQDLFTIKTGDNNEGILTVNYDNLDTYFGYLVLTVSLSDKGDPPMTNEVDVTVEVAKYNFKEPAFSFPFDEETVYLKKKQTPNSPLITLKEDAPLDNIKASDQQGEKFSLEFTITEDSSGDAKLFSIKNLGNSEAQLQITSDVFKSKSYTMVITASISEQDSIQGSAAFSKDVTLNVEFIDLKDTQTAFTNHQRTRT
ncbi:hypothetical protein Zmor_000233 [Zophobas morio]|uniref:Cadherin domain-containing protein n=1 Tax=Zophobas morio TaxID=2755281 RepID=A0AA38IZM4_9CUCU|nr:hypothetical protein Zmor_000233 [Zophobas morio]